MSVRHVAACIWAITKAAVVRILGFLAVIGADLFALQIIRSRFDCGIVRGRSRCLESLKVDARGVKLVADFILSSRQMSFFRVNHRFNELQRVRNHRIASMLTLPDFISPVTTTAAMPGWLALLQLPSTLCPHLQVPDRRLDCLVQDFGPGRCLALGSCAFAVAATSTAAKETRIDRIRRPSRCKLAHILMPNTTPLTCASGSTNVQLDVAAPWRLLFEVRAPTLNDQTND